MTLISICLPLSDIVCSCKALTVKLATFLYMQDFGPSTAHPHEQTKEKLQELV